MNVVCSVTINLFVYLSFLRCLMNSSSADCNCVSASQVYSVLITKWLPVITTGIV